MTIPQYGFGCVFMTQKMNQFIRISRSILHDKLLETARSVGVEIKMGTQITSFEKKSKESLTVVLSNGETIICEYLIGADGIKSIVRSILNIDAPKVYQGYLGVGVLYPGEYIDGFTISKGNVGMIGMANMGDVDGSGECKFL